MAAMAIQAQAIWRNLGISAAKGFCRNRGVPFALAVLAHQLETLKRAGYQA